MAGPSELETKISNEVSVQRLAEAHGIQLHKDGSIYTGSCPFHIDLGRFLEIDPSENSWCCKGECEAEGGPIEWLMEAEQVSREKAVSLLARDYLGIEEELLQASAPEEETPQAGSPEPPSLDLDVKDHEIRAQFEDRSWRVRGLDRNMAYDCMKVNLMVSRPPTEDGGPRVHVDVIDLYRSKARVSFVKEAAPALDVSEAVINSDLGSLLLRLEELQDQLIRDALELKDKPPELTDEERRDALAFLRDPNLLDRILEDFERCGVVGEDANKLVAYLGAVSRKLDQPLAVLVQSTSAAGKSSLMKAALAFVPEEDRVEFSSLTAQSLYYLGESDLRHKVLSIEEEEGASRASYPLKVLQSEGSVSICSTAQDSNTGRLVATEYRAQGPVALFMTTTAIDIDEELQNRCIVLTVDEDRDQTRAIHEIQRDRETLSGMLASEEAARTRMLHRNAQRMLRPLRVVNPYAPQLQYPSTSTRTRRDHLKYLALIRTIAFLRQYQRKVKTVDHGEETLEYIEVRREDIEDANKLAHEVLGRSLDDLPPQTRKLLLLVDEMVDELATAEGCERGEVRFSRRIVRRYTGWGDTQLKVHLRRLVELEYFLVQRRKNGVFEYELLYFGEGKDGSIMLPGLVDVTNLTKPTTWSALKGDQSGGRRPLVGGQSGGGRPETSRRSA